MSNVVNIIGKRFNNLIVIKNIVKHESQKKSIWKCRCDCGNTVNVSFYNLKINHVKSCGCICGGVIKDIVGNRYGHLLVLEFNGLKNNLSYWKCQCDCGKVLVAARRYLINGHKKSCGCSRYKIKHGMMYTEIYSSWFHMKQRCNNLNHEAYRWYGGKGITYSPEWEDFLGFKRDMWFKYIYAKKKYGKNIKLSIERRDNDDNYYFDNCEFIPLINQWKNKGTKHG